LAKPKSIRREWLEDILKYSSAIKIVAYLCPDGIVIWADDGPMMWPDYDGGFLRIDSDGA